MKAGLPIGNQGAQNAGNKINIIKSPINNRQ